MSAKEVIVAVALAIAVLLTLVCAVGLSVMRDPLQRLHFISPPATLSAALITIAVFLDDEYPQSGVKALIALLLFCVMNGVVTHATARAYCASGRAPGSEP